MKTIQQLKRAGHIKALPLQKFNVAEIDQAFMTFTKGSHIGKILVDYDDGSEKGINVSNYIPVYPYTHLFIYTRRQYIYPYIYIYIYIYIYVDTYLPDGHHYTLHEIKKLIHRITSSNETRSQPNSTLKQHTSS
jgi:hypothetical protein